jgi:hypothetical protein
MIVHLGVAIAGRAMFRTRLWIGAGTVAGHDSTSDQERLEVRDLKPYGC